jgi:MFS-type transporter involved in bile tolerance (Atg22 family)
MTGHWRILWLVVGGVACLDWIAKLWLLSAFFCVTCTAANVVLTSALPPVTTERISEAGVYYGDCASLILAVVLLPEPCGWERGMLQPRLRLGP